MGELVSNPTNWTAFFTLNLFFVLVLNKTMYFKMGQHNLFVALKKKLYDSDQVVGLLAVQSCNGLPLSTRVVEGRRGRTPTSLGVLGEVPSSTAFDILILMPLIFRTRNSAWTDPCDEGCSLLTSSGSLQHSQVFDGPPS